MKVFFLVVLTFFSSICFAQRFADKFAQHWADSVYNSLNEEERIGQLMIARLSSIDPKTRSITSLFEQTADFVKKYNIGGVCVFQGSPVYQAINLNKLKKMSKTPLLISIDGEWGVGMRIPDSVIALPKQMMLGAISNPTIIYQYGKIVSDQCKRLGIQMNYAPVMDINNNPLNPVINDRSFGENKYKVSKFGTLYMKGMQDNGVMACAKHFPGHGDVAVDSHFDLPVINKTIEQMDSVELFPFKNIFEKGVSSVMVGHLSIPSIDNRINRPTSLSEKNIKDLLQSQLHYEGIVITDGLEMQAVKKFYSNGEASVEALIAGNDLLCLPDSIPVSIEKIKQAILQNRLSWSDIEAKCKKVLMAKYKYVVSQNDSIELSNLTSDLNKDALQIRSIVAKNAITLLNNEDKTFFPLQNKNDQESIAYIGVGLKNENTFAKEMKSNFNATVFMIDLSAKWNDSIANVIRQISMNYKNVIIGIHQINRLPANNFGISEDIKKMIDSLSVTSNTIIFLFGNPYAAKNWCDARNLVVCYEDDSGTQKTAIKMLMGKIPFKGTLPVSICEKYQAGYGLPANENLKHKIDNPFLSDEIDSMINDAINKKAMPGCTVLAIQNDDTLIQKSYGYYTYNKKQEVTNSSVYDLASLTKILSTTLCLMKLYEEGKFDINQPLGNYLSMAKATNKENVIIKDLLLHQAGLSPFIPYYKETLDKNNKALKKIYSRTKKKDASIEVTPKMYIRNQFVDSFYQKILSSAVNTDKKYVYSDLDFILLGKMIEQITGMTLNEYVDQHFYSPMGLTSIGYLPLNRMSKKQIVPSTLETEFRNQELQGYVHDQSAAIMGAVAGHAGLFSNAKDISAIMKMLLNGGYWEGKSYLKDETIELFTGYQSSISRRGLGFDKPEKENRTGINPYPAKSCSSFSFGHLGFTGTCVWADPERNLIFVFLSNRIYPNDNGVFKELNLRGKIFEHLYQQNLK